MFSTRFQHMEGAPHCLFTESRCLRNYVKANNLGALNLSTALPPATVLDIQRRLVRCDHARHGIVRNLNRSHD